MTQIALVRAADLMQADVVTLQASMPIREAIETLEEYRISGAPVVDAAGNLVGVLSASDIVKAEHLQDDRIGRVREYHAYDPYWDDDPDRWWAEGHDFARDDYGDAMIGRETVGDWMTPEVFHVSSDATLREICSLIDKERVHRVFVVDDRKLRGVISTIDIVSYLART